VAITQETIVLNDFGVERRSRTTSKGTTDRVSVTIKSQLLLHEFDALALGQAPAQAIREILAKRIEAIQAAPSIGTLVFRKAAIAAYQRGARWALNRYARGRMEATPPFQGDRLFNDSGRLAKGIFVRENKTEQSWTVNVPANRFDVRTFRNAADLLRMIERLQSLVPELGDPRALNRHRELREVIADSIYRVITKQQELVDSKRAELRKRLLSLVTGGVSDRFYDFAGAIRG
jgi:hypothetical protein